MPDRRAYVSATCIKHDPDFVLVIGGNTDCFPSHTAELLFQTGGGKWRWRRLSSLADGRCNVGVLKLEHLSDENVQRALVVGGYADKAEVLTIACSNESDRGQWTCIEPLSRKFKRTFLVATHNRILAFGEFCLLLCVNKKN